MSFLIPTCLGSPQPCCSGAPCLAPRESALQCCMPRANSYENACGPSRDPRILVRGPGPAVVAAALKANASPESGKWDSQASLTEARQPSAGPKGKQCTSPCQSWPPGAPLGSFSHPFLDDQVVPPALVTCMSKSHHFCINPSPDLNGPGETGSAGHPSPSPL